MSVPARHPLAAKRGFSLVEILIVVLILGILAAIVVPKMSSASEDSRVSAARATLQRVRGQIELFRSQHAGIVPQTTGMWALLTSRSNTTETNVAAPAGTACGPYLVAPPQNPWNGLTGVSHAPVDTGAGWYYTCSTGTFELRARASDGSVNDQY